MISITDLHINLGEFALRGVSLSVEDGDYLMVLGPTGAGKTILLETLAGIYTPKSGNILIGGKSILNIPPRKRNIGMVYQDYMLFPHLSVDKNIRFGLKANKVDKEKADEKIKSLVELLNISHLMHRRPGTLSGGEQQRVAIARALIVEPRVLLLDEPLSALDAKTRATLREELRRIHDITGTTMIHVTHSFDEAFLLGNRMAIMDHGEIIQEGEISEVFRKPNCKFVADFVGTTNIFYGESLVRNGLSFIKIDGTEIVSGIPAEGHVYATVRPEAILLSLHPIESSARNAFKGKVSRILDEGSIIKVEINAGIPMIAAITRRSLEDMEIFPGKELFMTFKATDVHVFKV
ncbi:MAG: ATP-binding cassette domain-containing protein [Actinobacteria bacterium]|nr:ATP-binding cassette domain-containing protein [Actinomycetota bacterium]